MDFIRRIFKRKVMKDPVRTLRIDGVKTAMTPEPDDAELAAQALLETMTEKPKKKGKSRKAGSTTKTQTPEEDAKDAGYYQTLSKKIKDARSVEIKQAMRYVAYCEEQLRLRPDAEQVAELERGLYQWQDAVEREQGEVFRRWQHCLAECVVILMNAQANKDENEETDTV